MDLHLTRARRGKQTIQRIVCSQSAEQFVIAKGVPQGPDQKQTCLTHCVYKTKKDLHLTREVAGVCQTEGEISSPEK